MACGGGDDDLDGELLVLTKLRDPKVEGAKITLDFKVATGMGEPVPGLTFPGNFEVFEDGRAVSGVTSQPKIDTNPQNFKVYTLLLVDTNAGIRSVDADLATVRASVKSFATTVLSSGANRSVAVYAFDGRADLILISAFTSDAAALGTAIDTELTSMNTAKMLCQDPSSNLNGAVIKGLELLNIERQKGATGGGLTAGAMALFTDGVDRAGRRTYQEAIDAIRSGSNENAVFTIALESDAQDLAPLREYGRDGFVQSMNLDMLSAAFASVATRVNNLANSNYRLQYCTNRRAQSHMIEVKGTWTNMMQIRYIGFLPATFTAQDSATCQIQ
jgi:hypothetical protein